MLFHFILNSTSHKFTSLFWVSPKSSLYVPVIFAHFIIKHQRKLANLKSTYLFLEYVNFLNFHLQNLSYLCTIQRNSLRDCNIVVESNRLPMLSLRGLSSCNFLNTFTLSSWKNPDPFLGFDWVNRDLDRWCLTDSMWGSLLFKCLRKWELGSLNVLLKSAYVKIRGPNFCWGR